MTNVYVSGTVAPTYFCKPRPIPDLQPPTPAPSFSAMPAHRSNQFSARSNLLRQ